jgi:2'-5' RNA ligase
MHLTLKFFGDISYSDIDKIKTSMELLQKKTAAFATDIAGLGAFPALFRARVVWLGVANQSACRELHSAVERTLSRAGFERDKRPFAPHLTLGRFKKPLPSAYELLGKYRHVYCGKMMADRLVLFESRLHPRGAIHSPLFSISLGGTDSEDREVD